MHSAAEPAGELIRHTRDTLREIATLTDGFPGAGVRDLRSAEISLRGAENSLLHALAAFDGRGDDGARSPPRWPASADC